MKKIRFLSVAVLFAGIALLSPCFALQPGEKALPLAKVEWVNGPPFRVDPVDGEEPPEFRAVVFVLCRAAIADENVANLAALQRSLGGRLRCAIVTPDPVDDARALAARHPSPALPVGADRERKLTAQYMAGSLLYPQAFLIRRDGTILWRGEAIDLAEAAGRALAGKLDIRTEAEVSRRIDELQSRMRDREERQQRRILDEIFRLVPDQPAAVRMRLFVLENTGRYAEAWRFVEERLKAAPGSARLYFTALELAARSGADDARLEWLLAGFRRNIADPKMRLMMAWSLLVRFPENPAALRAAAGLLPASGDDFNFYAARAAFRMRIGDLRGALEDQNRAAAAARAAGDENAAAAALRGAEFLKPALVNMSRCCVGNSDIVENTSAYIVSVYA